MTTDKFFQSRESFREKLLEAKGLNSNGMIVDDIAIHHAGRV